MELKILQLLLFLCMNLLVSGVGAAAEVKCIERERQALLKFKESLTGDLSGLTWGSEEDKEECCNWYGVECSVTGHVIRLDLSDKHLRDIFRFSSLRNLHLSNNQLDGVQPQSFNQASSLEFLDLSYNQLVGSLPNITRFSSLKTLYLSNNHLDGLHPQSLHQPSSLESLDLSGNQLKRLPEAIEHLLNLKYLNLSSTSLEGNIISCIGQLDTLEWLDLSRNKLSGEIPNGLANLHFLSVLDLSYNNLMGKIPLSTQLQSFDSSAYAGNSQLCGDPLVECNRDPSVTGNGKVNVVEEDDSFINRDFYICMAFGFITGFWVVVGSLVLKHSWRHSYFKFWNSVRDWMSGARVVTNVAL
ncbi:receptor 12 [Olea europaea subsp. europaea]|uniref:Receptor 12 n=1 Tax=Olea europaea subsp. europaea TaxID=158383 RepID=A0A8S0V489_OLEEU|nr:receptor 12 [Olea europaea subsp. europaea]